MRILSALCLVGVLTAASSVAAQRSLPQMLTEPAPGPPAPRGSVQTPTAPTQTADGAFRISGGVMAGQAIKRVQPGSIPCGGPGGIVVMHAIIGTEGKVEQLNLVSGPANADYINAIMNTARQWEYKPYIVNGNSVRVDTTITMTIHRNGCTS